MNYLLYIEFAAENLQFYLWLQDYEKRFQALDVKNSVLSPEWDEKRNGTLQSEVPPTPGLASPKANPGGTVAKQLLAGTSFGPKGTSRITIQPSDDTLRSNKNPNPFDTPPRTPNGLQPPMTEAADIGKKIMTWAAKEIVPSHAEETAEAFNSVDLKWQPCEFFLPS